MEHQRAGRSGAYVGHCGLRKRCPDERRDRLGVREEDGVAGWNLDHGRVRPLGHRSLRRRRDHPVLRGYEVPAGFVRHAGSLIVPPRASTPDGTCESAMNSAARS